MTKDRWDKAGVLAQWVAAIAIPLCIAAATTIYQTIATEAAERRQWVQIGLDVLRDKAASRELRQWAVKTINSNATSPIPDAFWAEYSNGWTLPKPSSFWLSDDGKTLEMQFKDLVVVPRPPD